MCMLEHALLLQIYVRCVDAVNIRYSVQCIELDTDAEYLVK